MDFLLSADMSARVESNSASFIWLASIRFQMRSYRRNWSLLRKRRIDAGSLSTEVGRIASCASCAPFTLRL